MLSIIQLHFITFAVIDRFTLWLELFYPSGFTEYRYALKTCEFSITLSFCSYFGFMRNLLHGYLQNSKTSALCAYQFHEHVHMPFPKRSVSCELNQSVFIMNVPERCYNSRKRLLCNSLTE